MGGRSSGDFGDAIARAREAAERVRQQIRDAQRDDEDDEEQSSDAVDASQ